MTVAPLLVAFFRVIWLFIACTLRKLFNWVPKRKLRWARGKTYRCRRSAPQYFFACFSPTQFNSLAQHGTLETQSDAFESPDPTSLEFENRFNDLVSDAIEGTDRRIVLVVDNLDRLTAEQSLAVWSNLQTFVSQAALNGNGWSPQFCLLVPFTPSALRKLWKKAGAVTNVTSFFEKTFRIRYTTPPPTLSGWQGRCH